jgi:hypothetical protein
MARWARRQNKSNASSDEPPSTSSERATHKDDSGIAAASSLAESSYKARTSLLSHEHDASLDGNAAHGMLDNRRTRWSSASEKPTFLETQGLATEPVPNTPQDCCTDGSGELLLSDEQVQSFIVHGYLVLEPGKHEEAEGLSRQFHANIFDTAEALGERAEHLGNNILPAMPDLSYVFESRRVAGALKSLLGPGYLMHPHRFCHKSEPGREAQLWHRDSYWGQWHPRSHVPYWIMALYFPQDTPAVLGPTGILPHSQYYNKDDRSRGLFGTSRLSDADLAEGEVAQAWQVREHSLSCQAGTVVLIHYDIWHRGAANNSENGVRYMFKFQFMRMTSPNSAPCAWNCCNPNANWQKCLALTSTNKNEQLLEEEATAIPAVLAENSLTVASQMARKKLVGLATRALLQKRGTAADKIVTQEAIEAAVSQRLESERDTILEKNLQPVWQGIWDRLCGTARQKEELDNIDMQQLFMDLNRLGDEQEPRRIAAAWRSGNCWAAGSSEFLDDLVESFQDPRWKSFQKEKDRARMQALEATGPPAVTALLASPVLSYSPFAVRAMGRALDLGEAPTDTYTRALDVLSSSCTATAEASMRLCSAEALGSVRHPEAARVALHVARHDSDGDVRATACHSLLRLLQADILEESLEEFCGAFGALQEDSKDRYVAAYAAEGLHRVQHKLVQKENSTLGGECSRAPTLIRWCPFGNGWASKRQ